MPETSKGISKFLPEHENTETAKWKSTDNRKNRFLSALSQKHVLLVPLLVTCGEKLVTD